MRIITAGSEKRLLKVRGNTVAARNANFSWLLSPSGWPDSHRNHPDFYPNEDGHPYHGPGSSTHLQVPNMNLLACVQDYPLNEHKKMYEMVIKTKHAGPVNHAAVIPGNHDKLDPYETLVRSGGYSYFNINPGTNVFSIIVKIDNKYSMEKGTRMWYIKDGEATAAKLPQSRMVEFNKPRFIEMFRKRPDPDFFVFALCFNSKKYADETEILYVGPVLEEKTRESELPGLLAGVEFATFDIDDDGDESSDDELFSSDDELFSSDDELFSDDDGGDVVGPRESRDDDISNNKFSPDNNAADEVGVSTGCAKKRKYF
jgi:hypothetical protein